MRVEARRARQTSQLAFQGWGLEIALPAGRARVDIQADLRASLEVLAKASASLSARLKLGPLGLTLRLDASAFAQLVVKLCAQLRLRLDVGLGRPNLPELTVCRPVEARNVKGAFPFGALAGPGVLIVPGPGYGPAVLSLRGPGVGGLGLTADTIPVPADKKTVRTLLVLGGTLAAAGASREAESGVARGRVAGGVRRGRGRNAGVIREGPDGTNPVPSGPGPGGTKAVPSVPGTAGTKAVPHGPSMHPVPL